MPSVRAGGPLGGPCWASSAQLPKKSFRTLCPGPISPPDITGLAEEICLACTSSFRAGGALVVPGQPGVNFTGKLPDLGAHAP
eukprot:1147109-Pelagomonas_calceolata.AAC.2